MPYTPSGFFCDRLIRERERRDGEGSVNKPLRFSGQDFNLLKQEYLQKKTLFEDDTFPATVESLGYKELGHKSNKVKNIVWKRPKVGLAHMGNMVVTGVHGEKLLLSCLGNPMIKVLAITNGAHGVWNFKWGTILIILTPWIISTL